MAKLNVVPKFDGVCRVAAVSCIKADAVAQLFCDTCVVLNCGCKNVDGAMVACHVTVLSAWLIVAKLVLIR